MFAKNTLQCNERIRYYDYIIRPYLKRKGLLKEASRVEDMKEFVAYSKKLLRCLKRIQKLLDESNIDEAKILLNELIEDTQGNIGSLKTN